MSKGYMRCTVQLVLVATELQHIVQQGTITKLRTRDQSCFRRPVNLWPTANLLYARPVANP